MLKEKKSLNDATVGDVSIVFEKSQDDGSIFRWNFVQLSKLLLNEFLSVDPFLVNFETLVKSFLDNIGFDKETEEEGVMIKKEIQAVIKNELEFHKYICKNYFNLIKEPKEILLESFINASEDLKKIDETLSEIQKKIEEIHKNNNPSEIQEKKPILYYYQAYNEKAKSEILSFIKNDIKHYALRNSYDNSLLSSSMMQIPYRYKWNPKSYEPKSPNDLKNKFGEIPIQKFVELNEIYLNDKPLFYVHLTEYIQYKNILVSINDLVHTHHILYERKDTILETLNIYKKGAKIMFSIVVPSIIEGIFHDLCLLVGEKENDLLKEGFQSKLDRLQNHLDYELHYEYYSFRFRLFRNKVSHGRLTSSDVDELADMLLLDLHQVCNLVKSNRLKLNQKRFVIDKLNQSLATPDYKYLMKYLLLDKIEIPAFYKLDRQIEEVERLIVGNEFWEYIGRETDNCGEPVKHGIYMLVKVISNRKPFDKRCTTILKKLGIEKIDKEMADIYLEDLTYY